MSNSISGSTNPTGARRKFRNSDKRTRAPSEHSTKRFIPVAHRRSYSVESRKENQSKTSSDGVPSKGNSTFEEFLIKVNCPFCLKVKKDKTSLVEHLGKKCRVKPSKGVSFTTFQILPTNSIKCNFCPNAILHSLEGYFNHANSSHEKYLVGKDYLYCSCCRFLVPNNLTQLECHLKNKTHNTRRKSLLDSDYCLSKGIFYIYCFYNTNNKKFKCLSCPPPNFLFNTPLELLKHLKTAKHLQYADKRCITILIHCSFCDENVSETATAYHFVSKSHQENENKITGTGQFQLCIYCGLECGCLRDLSTHMRSNCEGINKIRREMGWTESVKKETKMTISGAHKLHKKKCILVPEDVDIVELTKTLKNLGKIQYVGPYDEHRVVIEFQKEETLEFVLLVHSFIKVNGVKLKNIEFFNKEEIEDDETVCSPNV